MAVSADSAPWQDGADRKAFAVWLGIIWLAMIIGFAVDVPGFLHQTPAAADVVYLHGAVFVGWIILFTTQVVFVLRGRMSEHRRLGSKAGYIALLMVPLGVVTALTTDAQALTPHTQGLAPPQFLALQVEDLIAFGAFIALGLKFRRDPAAHRRLMILSMVALADAGFGRATEYLFNPATPLAFFLSNEYGNVLLIAAMFGWDLWRRGRVHRALLLGGLSLIAVELVPAFAYFNPTWGDIATSIVRAWGHAA